MANAKASPKLKSPKNDDRTRVAGPRPPAGPRIKVRATQAGYIGDGALGQIYRKEGDVFWLTPREVAVMDRGGKPALDADTDEPLTRTLSAESQFSKVWMELVDEDVPEKITTAQKDVNEQIGELNKKGAAIDNSDPDDPE